MSLADVDSYILFLLRNQKVMHNLPVMCSISMQTDNRSNIKTFFMLLMVFYFHLEMDISYFYDIFNS